MRVRWAIKWPLFLHFLTVNLNTGAYWHPIATCWAIVVWKTPSTVHHSYYGCREAIHLRLYYYFLVLFTVAGENPSLVVDCVPIQKSPDYTSKGIFLAAQGFGFRSLSVLTKGIFPYCKMCNAGSIHRKTFPVLQHTIDLYNYTKNPQNYSYINIFSDCMVFIAVFHCIASQDQSFFIAVFMKIFLFPFYSSLSWSPKVSLFPILLFPYKSKCYKSVTTLFSLYLWKLCLCFFIYHIYEYRPQQ